MTNVSDDTEWCYEPLQGPSLPSVGRRLLLPVPGMLPVAHLLLVHLLLLQFVQPPCLRQLLQINHSRQDEVF